MGRLRVLLRRIVGGGIDRPLLPIVAVTFTGSIAGGMLWVFIGIWATKRLDASSAVLAFAFLAAAAGGRAAVPAGEPLPHRGRYTPQPTHEQASLGSVLRGRILVVFFVSGVFSTFVYVAYEVVLPISLTGSHGFAPSTWGFLLIVNPAMVTLFQLRVTA